MTRWCAPRTMAGRQSPALSTAARLMEPYFFLALFCLGFLMFLLPLSLLPIVSSFSVRLDCNTRRNVRRRALRRDSPRAQDFITVLALREQLDPLDAA